MAPPYSTDLRWQIVWSVLTFNSSPDVVARLFNVSTRTVTRCLNLFMQTGYVIPRRRRYGPFLLMGDYEQLILLRLILERPGPGFISAKFNASFLMFVVGIYVSEIQCKFFYMFVVEFSVSTIRRTLKVYGVQSTKNSVCSPTTF